MNQRFGLINIGLLLVFSTILPSCNSSKINVTLKGRFGVFDDHIKDDLIISGKSNTPLNQIENYHLPTPYFNEVHTFSYWSLDEAGTQRVNENYVIKKDTTLYAQYDQDIPYYTSYLLFNSQCDSQHHNEISFAYSCRTKAESYINITANIDKQYYEFELYEGVKRRDFNYGCKCTFNYNGPVLIKIEGDLDVYSFSELQEEGEEKHAISHELFAPGNEHIIAAVLPKCSLASTARYGFADCNDLRAVAYSNNFPLNAKEGLFENCFNLTTLSNTATHISNVGASAFYNCQNLNYIPGLDTNQINSISKNAFANCPAIKKITVGENCAIEEKSFANCFNLEEIEFNCKFENANYPLFNGDNNLKHITFNNTIRRISSRFFTGCDNLNEITFKNQLPLDIDAFAFNKCLNLTSLKLPRSLNSIGSFAFANIPLETLDLSSLTKVVPCGNSLFNGKTPMSDMTGKIIVDSSLVDDYKSSEGWKEYKDLIIAK